MKELAEALKFVRSRITLTPRIALVLGSGLGALADEVDEAEVVTYREIPHCPETGVLGHDGALVFGYLEGCPVVVMRGRLHYYEGHSLEQLVFPLRLMYQLGAREVLFTNAAGGLDPAHQPGDFMLIRDHLNMMFQNPLIGANIDELGTRFPDLSAAYDVELCEQALAIAKRLKLPMHEGIYAAMTGPAYETPAEIRMLRQMGADAVGMSTVPEVIAARHMGMRVLAVSCISNLAAGIAQHELSHEEVTETTARVRLAFVGWLREMLVSWPQTEESKGDE